MSKKILSVMLAVMLVLSTFAVTAFAAGSDFEVEDETEGVILSTQTWSLSDEATKVSDSVYKVDVALTTNYVTGAISFRVDAANGATLTDVEINEAVITYAYDVAFNANGLVAIVPQPANEADEGIEVDGVIATLTYTLAGDGDVLTLVNDAKTEANPGGDLIAVRLDDNNLSTGTMLYGQRVVDANGDDIDADAVIATVTLGEAVAAPVLKGVNTGFVDADKKYVYGVPAGDDANNYFTVENGSFDMTANADGYTNGTGAILTVKDGSGNAIDTYTLIIFGDVNGDATITGADGSAVQLASLGATIDGDAANFAADVNADGAVTGADGSAVQLASLGGEITINPYVA